MIAFIETFLAYNSSAGFAGGIVSAAVDGIVVAGALLNKLSGVENRD